MKHLWYAKEDGIKELVGLWTDADIFKKVGDRNLWNINKKKKIEHVCDVKCIINL